MGGITKERHVVLYQQVFTSTTKSLKHQTCQWFFENKEQKEDLVHGMWSKWLAILPGYFPLRDHSHPSICFFHLVPAFLAYVSSLFLLVLNSSNSRWCFAILSTIKSSNSFNTSWTRQCRSFINSTHNDDSTFMVLHEALATPSQKKDIGKILSATMLITQKIPENRHLTNSTWVGLLLSGDNACRRVQLRD